LSLELNITGKCRVEVREATRSGRKTEVGVRWKGVFTMQTF
jgi:hypothetical protein